MNTIETFLLNYVITDHIISYNFSGYFIACVVRTGNGDFLIDVEGPRFDLFKANLSCVKYLSSKRRTMNIFPLELYFNYMRP